MITVTRTLRAAAVGVILMAGASAAWAADFSLSVNTALQPQDPLFQGLNAFKENVEKRSDGKIAVRLFPGSQLGKDEDVLEQARAGAPVRIGAGMFDLPSLTLTYLLCEWAVRLVMIVVIPLRRPPESARSWLLLVLFLPIPALILYRLIGRASFPAWRKA